MRRTLLQLGLVLMIGLMACTPVNPPLAGEPAQSNPWSEILLPTPPAADTRQYLGLPAGEHFTVGQIAADVIIVQVYSMYCPHCQREAPRVNELYALIQEQAGLDRRVKLVGVGIGNSAFEVDFYRETYGVRFPLFPDGKFVIHKQLGETRTPHFFVLKPLGNGKVAVVYERIGGFDSPQKFLKRVQKHIVN